MNVLARQAQLCQLAFLQPPQLIRLVSRQIQLIREKDTNGGQSGEALVKQAVWRAEGGE
jgi:hypothetical protein